MPLLFTQSAGAPILSRRTCLGLAAAVAMVLVPTTHAQDNATPPPATPVLELLVLGSGGPGATGRAGSCYAVLVDGVARILVDAGPGSFVRVGESKLSLAKTDIILLTHLHADHAGELPGLLKARAVSVRGSIQFNIFGPDGHTGHQGEASFPSTRRFVDQLFGPRGAFGYLPSFSAPVSFKTTNVPVMAGAGAEQPKTIYSADGLRITAAAGHHRDAPAVVYRVDYGGKSITFSGDVDAAGLGALRQLATGSDLLVFNSVVLDPPGSPPVLYTLHSPPKAIGELARDAQVGKLLLSHLSPSTENHSEAVAASIAQSFTGPVEFASDGIRITP
jgi:ribonuclease BN (tRNA processing enzyme)